METFCNPAPPKQHPPPPPSVRFLHSLLRTVLRVSTADGRIFLGTLAAADKQLNLLLVSADEFHPDPRRRAAYARDGRFVGQIMIPWRLVVRVEAPYDAVVAAEAGDTVGDMQRGREREEDEEMYT